MVKIKQMMEKDESLGYGDSSDDADLELNDERTWLLLDCRRTEAENLLKTKPDGTFLIRKSSTNQYALSIACKGSVNHCIINQTAKGLGFAEPYNLYDSLKSLVLHYSQNSLEIHNDALNTTLKRPIHASKYKEIRQTSAPR